MITQRVQLNNNEDRNHFLRPLTRRNLLGAGSSVAAALLAATVGSATADQDADRTTRSLG